MKKKIRILINLILIITLIYSAYKIINKYYNYHKDVKKYESIQDKSPFVNKNNDFKTENSDYLGWIKIENTNIDYPVMQGEDNQFYLQRDFRKDKNISGSIFLDYRNNISKDKNLILYGHNMRNGSMFSEINKFKDKDFFNEDNKIELILGDEKRTYEVFSVYADNADDYYLNTEFKDYDEFKSYIESEKNKSWYKKNIKFTRKDKIITLSTCSYEGDNYRTVVYAKEIKREKIN
ncbi:MAG: class B sortase [Clostridium sp.]